MRVLLTGGSGDLGRILIAQFAARGDVPINLDLAPPAAPNGQYVKGSVLDRDLLKSLHCRVWIAWCTLLRGTGFTSFARRRTLLISGIST